MEGLLEPSTATARALLFEDLYARVFPAVARFIHSRGGNYEDARDIFQDALIIYFEKTRTEEERLNATGQGYILGIAKHLWVRKFRHEKRNVSFDAMEVAIAIPDDFDDEVQEATLLRFLERAGKKCMELLTAFYFEKLSLNGVCDRFGYGSARSATVQKFKCLEKVRDVVKERSMRYEDFTE